MRAAFAFIFAITACTAPTFELLSPPQVPGDASTDDARTADANNVNRDASLPRDAGRPIRDSGIEYSCEGCPCSSSYNGEGRFQRDNCDFELVCVPWDTLSRRNLDGPFQSCARPCNGHAECGSGRCVETGFHRETGLEKACVDRVVSRDNYCGFHGLDEQVDFAPLRVASNRAGCSAPFQCARDVFHEVHAGEGVCLVLCQTDSECPLDAPVCNFLHIRQFGICSPEELGPGALCTEYPGTDRTVAGFMSICDGDPNDLGCVHVPELFPEGKGFCAGLCDHANPCLRSEPNLGAYTCTSLPGPGKCTVPCSNHPENCEGLGRNGQGYACFDQIVSGATTELLPFCIERLETATTASLLNYDGTGVFRRGDPCDTRDSSALHCPEPTFCAFEGPGEGLCLIGCDPAAPNACAMVSATATCTPERVCGDR
jgi:hypothetical protein